MFEDVDLPLEVDKRIENPAVLDWVEGLLAFGADSAGVMVVWSAEEARKLEASHQAESLLDHRLAFS